MGGGHGEPELHSGGEFVLAQAHTVQDLVGYLGELPVRALGCVLGLGKEVLRRLQTLSRAARGKMWQIDQIRPRELGGDTLVVCLYPGIDPFLQARVRVKATCDDQDLLRPQRACERIAQGALHQVWVSEASQRGKKTLAISWGLRALKALQEFIEESPIALQGGEV